MFELSAAPGKPLRALCTVAALRDAGCLGFAATQAGAPGLFAIYRPQGPVVFVNSCPHLGVPLDWHPGRFLNEAGNTIVCATHGAEFLVDTGQCLRGPCRGDFLTKVACCVADETLMVAADAAQ